MSKFDDVKQKKYLETLQQRMVQVKNTNSALLQALRDARANWAGYAALEADSTELEAAFASYSADIAVMWADAKVELAEALDILAGGLLDGQGQQKTRADLIAEIAAVVLPE